MSRNSLLWIFLILMMVVLYRAVEDPAKSQNEIAYSEFRQLVQDGNVAGVTIKEDQIVGEFKEGTGPSKEFITYPLANDNEIVSELLAAGVKIQTVPVKKDSWLMVLLANLFPMLLLIGVWIFFMRQMQVGGGKAMSFGKSKAKLMEEGENKITFADVAGIEESKQELESIVKFLKDPKKFTKLGGRIPRGVLLVGSPGTGKTLLAKAIAGEAGVPFFTISGSDFVEMFVGVGASRVRDLFLKGKKNAPCIIFIDEIDAVGRHRGAGLGGGHDEREQTLNQLLVEMDGFEGNEGVIMIAATNRPDVLDPALLRPGRFDRQVMVPLPDIKGRVEILKVHVKKVPLDDTVDLEVIARGTPGFSGADLANLVNEAALYAALQESEKVSLKQFDYAKDKIMMGAERRSMVLSDNERRVSAYHEAGHALIAKLVEHADPVHKVTIIPRGMALGLMQQLPEADRHTYSREYWIDRICITFGGRAAEEQIFNAITTGASSDIVAATTIARRMVCEWGMSEKLGPMAYGAKDGAVFLGKEISHQRDYSEETAKEIDNEVRSIIDQQLNRARKILKENADQLELLAQALLVEETLDTERVDKILSGSDTDPGSDNNDVRVNA